MSKGFYRIEENGGIQRGEKIDSPSGSFTEANKLEIPEESGWKWFETSEEAYAYFATAENPLLAFWGVLDLQTKLTVYSLAPEILTAFNGGDTEALLHFIQTNDAPELEELKTQVLTILQ